MSEVCKLLCGMIDVVVYFPDWQVPQIFRKKIHFVKKGKVSLTLVSILYYVDTEGSFTTC